MPIVRLPGGGSQDAITVTLRDVHVPDGVTIPAGTAVAVTTGDSGLEFALCGAGQNDHPHGFAGFALRTGNPNSLMTIITGRGSKVTPVVEGGGPMTPDTDVWLAITPGEVTQTLTYEDEQVALRVGRAISTTEMILLTDARIVLGG